MKLNKFLSLSFISLLLFTSTSCDGNGENGNNQVVLNVYNCADYICETTTDEETGEVIKGVLDQFEDYVKETYNVDLKINYSTYETNEDMYNQLVAGGVQYDLICPSDYLIEKLIANDMIEPLSVPMTNYEKYGSNYIKSKFDTISAYTKDNKPVTFKDYSVPYMWGTMGFMYDPDPEELDSSLDINEDIKSWDIIWDENYYNKVSLKDSIRDTYITGTFHVYKEEIKLLQELLDNGYLTIQQYNERLTNIMNRCDDSTIPLVEGALKKAKENIFEFEVDTGKEHIVKGDYYVNLCWSGDAVYSLELAAEEDVTLKYVVPIEGSNVWFDGWCMPKGANTRWAQELMNFLCDPEIASQNMDAVGYTSAIAGTDIWNLVNDWYNEDDPEAIDYDLSYFFEGSDVVDDGGNLVNEFIVHTTDIDGMLYAQYPSLEVISRCCVMKDFGKQNDKVSEMWIRVKGNSTSVVIIIVLLFVVGLIVFGEVKNLYNKRARKNRNRK